MFERFFIELKHGLFSYVKVYTRYFKGCSDYHITLCHKYGFFCKNVIDVVFKYISSKFLVLFRFFHLCFYFFFNFIFFSKFSWLFKNILVDTGFVAVKVNADYYLRGCANFVSFIYYFLSFFFFIKENFVFSNNSNNNNNSKPIMFVFQKYRKRVFWRYFFLLFRYNKVYKLGFHFFNSVSDIILNYKLSFLYFFKRGLTGIL